LRTAPVEIILAVDLAVPGEAFLIEGCKAVCMLPVEIIPAVDLAVPGEAFLIEGCKAV
jgi:hypothetical protein